MIITKKLNGMGLLVLGLLASTGRGAESPKIETGEDRFSYGIGVDIARNSRRQGIELNLDLVIRGLKDGLSGERLLIPEDELRKAMVQVQAEMRQRRGPNQRTAAEANKLRGEVFMKENLAKPGVTALANGVQYKILKTGTGPKPGTNDIVECFYRCMLMEGTEIVGSPEGKPGTFKVSDAFMAGWVEVLPLMPVGSKWQIIIPPQLAYGARGAGRRVGPNETIVTELELAAIKPATEPEKTK